MAITMGFGNNFMWGENISLPLDYMNCILQYPEAGEVPHRQLHTQHARVRATGS